MCRIAVQQPYAGRNSGRCGGGGNVSRRRVEGGLKRGLRRLRSRSRYAPITRAHPCPSPRSCVCPGQQHPREHVTSVTSAVPALTSRLTSIRRRRRRRPPPPPDGRPPCADTATRVLVALLRG